MADTIPADKRLFIEDTPLIDVRAPVEFLRGAFPTAVNLPILNDEERTRVGICYKHEGNEAAVRLGHELVSGAIRDARLGAWVSHINAHPGAVLYCFRGGQRSRLATEWCREAGHPLPRVEGGYKALRQQLLDVFDELPPLFVVAGKTGVGKTVFLAEAERAGLKGVDLEKRANHRGSAFGHRATPQPAQIDFENSIAIDFLKSSGPVLLEDEGRMIGRVNLPVPLQEAMKAAPLLLLESSLEDRIRLIHAEYLLDYRTEIERVHGHSASAKLHEDRFLNAIDAIRKRLGGQRHVEVRQLMADAFSKGMSLEDHGKWIEVLLTQYYDPMYEYQLQHKQERIVARGNMQALLRAAADLLGQS